jgi:hypothetical protein
MHTRIARTLVTLAALGCSLASAQTTWTVNDDGPADFNDLQAAVDAALDGDRLVIAPGSYGNVTVQKALTFVGVPTDTERVELDFLHVHGTSGTTVLSLDLEALQLENLSGLSHVEDVRTTQSCRFDNAGRVLAARCAFDQSGWSSPYVGPAGAEVYALDAGDACHVQFVDCILRGGTGFTFDLSAGTGGSGLDLFGGSALVTGCQLEAGLGTDGVKQQDGSPGPGAYLFKGDLEVRGAAQHVIAGASQGGTFGTQQANAIQLQFESQASLSGVTAIGPLSPGVELPALQPWLRFDRSPGQADLQVFGPPGDPAFWVVSAQSAFEESFVPSFGLPLTLDFAQQVASGVFVLAGQAVPAEVGFSLPAQLDLAGLVFPSQAVAVDVQTGLARLTNGDDLILGL